MWKEGAIQRWIGAGDVSRARIAGSSKDRAPRVVAWVLVALAALFAGPVAAQATSVSISGADRPSFSRAGQPLTFHVRLDAGNVADISGLSFTSGSPAGMSAVSCPGWPGLNGSVTCSFTYTTTDQDVAMGQVMALGRWRAIRSGGAAPARSGTTNTFYLAYTPPRAPDAPIVTTVTAGDGTAIVSFAPQFDGGYPIDSYTVTSQPQGITATASGGPITVTGLTNGTTYRFTVAATSTIGASSPSNPSAPVTPKSPQTIAFTNPGTQTFGTMPTVTATASSDLAVTFTSGTTSVCTVTTAGALTFLRAGTCTIRADQAGDTVYDPAPRVSRSFTVDAVAPDAPVMGTATAGDGEATVTFTAPASSGGLPINHYTLTSSPGGITATGNGSPMSITGLTNFTAYTFTVVANTGYGDSDASAASNSVTPSSAPVVASVSVPANGTYAPGEALDFVVNWDQAVTIAGTPQIPLLIGSTTVQANYVSGSGTSATLFRYTVLPGQMDANGITVGALSLNGGSIRNAYAVDAAITLNSVGSTAGVLVGAQNQAPVNTAPSAATVIENGTLAFAGSVSVSDADAGNGLVHVMLVATNGRLTLSGTTGLSFDLGTGTNDTNMAFSGTIADINTALSGLTFRPTTGYFGPASLQITTDDQGNTGFGGPKSVTSNVAITVTPLDTTPPVVSTIDLAGATPTRATSLAYVVTFSEAVTGVNAGVFTLFTTGNAAGTIASVSTNDNVHYTVTVNNVSGDGTLRLSLNNGSGVSDAAGNPATAYNGGPSYTLDNMAPVLDSVSVPAAGQYIAGQTLFFSLHFNENVQVTGSPTLPFTLDASGTRNANYTGGSGTNVLTFAYTVVSGDQDLDGPGLGSAIALNGGTIADLVGNVAPTALNNVGSTSGIVVGLLPQAITAFASNPTAPTFAPNGTFAVAATGGASGLPVVFASTTASVCSVAGNTVTTLAAGTCSLTANQAGNANYSAAAQATLDVTIAAATQAITGFVANPATPTFAPNGTFTVSATPGVSTRPVVFASTTGAICTVSGNTVTMLAAGTCSLTADQAGDANYVAAPQLALDVTIAEATQAIVDFRANPAAPVYSPNGTFALSATKGASSSAVVFASTTSAVCTVSGDTVTMRSAGTCSLTANQAGDGNYSAAPQVVLDVAIAAATQAITGFIANPGAPVFAPNGTFTLAALGGASGNAVVFASTSPAVCTVAGNVVTMKAAGTCALTADQAGSNDYVAAAQVALQVVIGRATPTLSWVGEMNRVIGEAAFDLPDPGSDSRGAFTFASTNTAVATVSGRRVTLVGAGVTTLVATQAPDGNYAQGTVSTTLTVTDRPDPTKDASVSGGLQAQVDASLRFAAAQLTNIQGRLREQRMAGVNRSSNDLTFAMASRSGGAVSMSAEQFTSMDTSYLPQGLALWTAGAITTGGRDADSRGSDSDFRSDGITVGADWRFNDRVVFGVAGGWGWNDTDLDDARSRLDAQQRAVSMYGLWRPSQRWFVDGILGWGDLDFDIRRHSDVANAVATASRNGDQTFGALTAGYEHGGGVGMTLTGYGRLDASRTTLDAYREQGLGIYDLAYGSQTVDNSGASLGVEGSFPILTPRGTAVRPYWMLEYRETLDNRSDVELNYAVLPVDGGYVLGMRGFGDNALTYGGGIDMELARGWKLSLLGRRQHGDGQRPSSTFGLMVSFSPVAGSATVEPTP